MAIDAHIALDEGMTLCEACEGLVPTAPHCVACGEAQGSLATCPNCKAQTSTRFCAECGTRIVSELFEDLASGRVDKHELFTDVYHSAMMQMRKAQPDG